MSSRRVVFAAFVLACTTASCAAVLGFERLTEEAPDDGAIDGSSDASRGDATPDAASGPCTELGIPPPPEDAATGLAPPILAALRLLDFGIEVDGGRPQIPGYNLDLTCSIDLASSSCTSKLLPTTFETHAKDKTSTGVDNAGFSLLEYISRFSDVLSARAINEGIQDGRYGAVIRVDAWNGQPDDDGVEVDVFPAIGFNPRDDGSKPAFDDDDRWVLDSRFRVGGVLDASTIKSDRAWVTGGQLVARFKEIVLPIVIDSDPKPFEIHVRDAIVTANVATSSDGKTVLRDGVVSGRWKTSDFLGEVRTIFIEDSNGLKNTVLCDPVPGATLIYEGVKAAVCDGRDIRSDSKDNAGEACDAVSAAARIEAYSVKSLGTFAAPLDGGLRCVDAAIPAGDDCP